MKELAHAVALPPMLAALDRALASGGASALAPGIPNALWRKALAGPAAEFLSRPGKALRTTIVRAGWTLGGGAPAAMPAKLPLALELVHAGSLIVDDIEDGSAERRGAPALHHVVGVPLAINTGSWLYFWALAELGELGIAGAVELAARALVRCHQGQALDLAARIAEIDVVHAATVVETITRLKTGALCALAAELGALAAGATDAVRHTVARFAEQMGIALQMLDDLGSITSASRRDKGREDLRNLRATWPWAWLADQDPFAWTRIAGRARDARDDAELDGVASALAVEIGSHGRACIRATLDAAIEDLVGAVGSSPAIDAIAAELARMEASYG